MESARSNAEGPLVRFNRKQTVSPDTWTLGEIRNFDFDELESHHDFIQWLFPTRTRSLANPDRDLTIFRSDETLRSEVLASFEQMLAFYGLQLRAVSGVLQVERSSEWNSRSENWLTRYNHNFLRITRILTCLTLVGLDEYARAFLSALESVYEEDPRTVGLETLGYWRSAVR